MCVYAQLNEGAYGNQKVALDPMKLDIQIIASHFVGDGDRTFVLSMLASDFKQGAISFVPVLFFFKVRVLCN